MIKLVKRDDPDFLGFVNNSLFLLEHFGVSHTACLYATMTDRFLSLFIILICALVVDGLHVGHSRRTGLIRGSFLFNKRGAEHLTMSSSTEEGDEKPLGVEETTKKYGLEAGLFKAVTNKDGKEVKPGELLKKYGAAYLITSITFAIISYAICYFLVSAGVDVASLLKKVGIEVSTGATNAGTCLLYTSPSPRD